MKTILLFIFISIFPSLLSGQKLKTITEKFPETQSVKVEYTVLKKKKYIKQGEYKIYFENGQIKEEGKYENSKKVGEWNEYNYHNDLRRVRKYEMGKLISDNKFGIWKEFGKNGKPYFYDYDKGKRIIPQIPIPVEFPAKAREAGIEGSVQILVKLNDQCELKKIEIVKSSGNDFDKAAIKGVKKFIEKLKYFEDDCINFEEIITIDFKIE